jgi:putative toxin-antitoxin system antitoxin component (TIGR02293 family)
MLYELLDFTEGQFPAGLGWHDKIVGGFPQSSLWSVSRALGVEPIHTANLVGLPADQVNWRKRGDLLSSGISDKLFKLARAYQRLMVPFKDEEMVTTWLRTAQPALADQIPVVLLMSLAGSQEVMAAIDNIKPLKSVEMNPVFEDFEEDPSSAPDDERTTEDPSSAEVE